MGSPEPESEVDGDRWDEVEGPSVADWVMEVHKEVGDPIVEESDRLDQSGSSSGGEVELVEEEGEGDESLPVPDSLATGPDVLLLPFKGGSSAVTVVEAPVVVRSTDPLPLVAVRQECFSINAEPTVTFLTPSPTRIALTNVAPCSTDPLPEAPVTRSTPTPSLVPSRPLDTLSRRVDAFPGPPSTWSSPSKPTPGPSHNAPLPSLDITPVTTPSPSTHSASLETASFPSNSPAPIIPPPVSLIPSKRPHPSSPDPSPIPISRPTGWTVPPREREWDPTWGMEMARKKRRWE